jgi:archaellum component FlaC
MTEADIIESIVNKVVEQIDLASLQKCQAELKALREDNRRLEQNFLTYHELAEHRGKQTVDLTNQVKELELRIGLLTSAVENLTNGD